jgi:predicted aspartyl protease
VKAPSDPWVLLRAAGAAPTRARATELLNAYIAHGLGEDPDRIEGARGTLRLYAALGERKIWIPVERPERLSIPLKPIVGGSGYYVEAALAGKKKIRLLLDTGSSGLFVVERAVKKGGLVPLSDETVFAGGGSGRASSSRGLLTRLDLGGLVFADALVTTTRDEFDPQGRIHGVLGISAFAGYRITLDLAKGRLLLEPPGEPLPGSPYWNVEGQLLVRARGGEASAGLFLFDTGATQSMVDSKFAATVGGAQIDSPTAVHTYGGNIAGASIVRGMSLAFQDLKRAGAFNTADLTMRSRLGGVEVSGYLGMDVLAGCAIVVDTKSHRVAVTPPPARP